MKRQHYLMMSCLCTAVAITSSLQAKDRAQIVATPTATSTTASEPTAAGKSTSADTVAASDRDLMRKLAFANIAEIATANLALKKSSNDTVKAFAQHMLDDHTKAGEELTALAQRKNVALPTVPDAQHASASKKMALLSGTVFDQLYLHEAGVVDHRATLRLLKNIDTYARDSDLKALAQKMTPTVEAHLDMVQKETAASRNDGDSHRMAKANDEKGEAAKTPAAK